MADEARRGRGKAAGGPGGAGRTGRHGSDRIVLSGLEFHARHGVHDEEARFGARFVVDVELYLPVGGSDRLGDTADYSRVYEVVRAEVTERRYRLIETVADRLAHAVLEASPNVREVVVRVHKPHAPLPGVVRDVFVEVRRTRE